MSHFDNVKKFFDDERFSDKILCFVLPSNSSSSVAESHDEGEGINLSPIAEESQPQGIDQEPRSGTARQVVRRIHVSSMLLASSSRFFEAMFSSGMKESNQKELEIQVADIAEAERIGHIIRFCYSTELPSHWIVVNLPPKSSYLLFLILMIFVERFYRGFVTLRPLWLRFCVLCLLLSSRAKTHSGCLLSCTCSAC